MADRWEQEAARNGPPKVSQANAIEDRPQIQPDATISRSTPFPPLYWPEAQTRTGSSKANRRPMVWKFSDSTSEVRARVISNSKSEPKPSTLVDALAEILAKRKPQLEAIIQAEKKEQNHQAEFKNWLKEHGMEMESNPSPPPNEHWELLEHVWKDFIARKEPGAWGEMWIDENKEIRCRCLGEIEIQKTVPSWEENLRHPNAVAVIVRWATNDYSERAMEIETESAASATVILEERLFQHGLPPDDDPLILDGPFQLLDIMESEAESVLNFEELAKDDNLPQREIACDVITGVKLARQKLWHALKVTRHAQSTLSCAAWLHTLGFCMVLADKAREMGEVIPRSSEKKASSARKLVQTQKTGGHQHTERQKFIEMLAAYHSDNPSKPLHFALKRFGIRKNAVNSLFMIPGLGERKLSAIREMWTEARQFNRLRQKDSETGPIPKSTS